MDKKGDILISTRKAVGSRNNLARLFRKEEGRRLASVWDFVDTTNFRFELYIKYEAKNHILQQKLTEISRIRDKPKQKWM